MKKNLFLVGMPYSGKSTIINRALEPVRHLTAGFKTARVLSSEGKKRGFAQFPADSDTGIEVTSDADLPNQFLVFDDGSGRSFKKELLVCMMKQCLTESLSDCEKGSKKLIVMDEVGGLELENDGIFSLIRRTVDSPWPCIGVIKCREHAEHLLAGKSPDQIHLKRYFALYDEWKERPDTLFLNVTEQNRTETGDAVRKWIGSLKLYS